MTTASALTLAGPRGAGTGVHVGVWRLGPGESDGQPRKSVLVLPVNGHTTETCGVSGTFGRSWADTTTDCSRRDTHISSFGPKLLVLGPAVGGLRRCGVLKAGLPVVDGSAGAGEKCEPAPRVTHVNGEARVTGVPLSDGCE